MDENDQPSSDPDPEENETREQERDAIIERIGMGHISKKLRATIDLDMLVDDTTHVFPGAPKDASKDLKNTWIIKVVSGFGKADGISLQEAFVEDFYNWIEKDFDECDTLIVRALKQHLLKHGITLPGSIKEKTSTRLERLINAEFQETYQTSNPELTRAAEQLLPWTNEQRKPPLRSPPKQQTRFPIRPQNTVDHRTPDSQIASTSGSTQDDTPPAFYHLLPPTEAENMAIDGAQMKQFIVLWSKENNYSGDTYDILDDKVRIFTDICELLHIKYRQLHALFPSILKGRAQRYFLDHMNRGMQYRDMYLTIKQQFDSEINRAQYHTDWSSMTFNSVASEHENAGKTRMEVLDILLERIQKCQRALGPAFAGDIHLISATLRAVQGVPELKIALARPERSFNALSSQLKSTLQVEENTRTPGHFLTDRRYEGSYQRKGPFRDRQDHGNGRRERPTRGQPSNFVKKCWICGEPNCWSTKHTESEQKRSREQWIRQREIQGQDQKGFKRFLMSVEPDSSDDESEREGSDYDYVEERGSFMIENTAFFLADESFRHRLGEGALKQKLAVPVDQIFHQHKLASATIWYGIIPDTGAAEVSTAGRVQAEALLTQMPSLKIEHGKGSRVRFGAGEPLLTTEELFVPTPIGGITFHIVPTDTPFLLCIKDMDALRVYLDNTRNELVKHDGKIVRRIPIIRKWGHPWFFLSDEKHSTAGITYTMDPASVGATSLTEAELRRIHKRFGHPSVEKLWKLLHRADHDVTKDSLELINRFCHFCQIKGTAPQRFKFSLKDDIDFNYEIIVDILSLAGKPVLHVVDASTGFQAAGFLPNFSARATWETLKRCWLDTYLGPPDVITVDAGTNFASTEFKAEARLAGITCHQIPIEAHWSIGKVERFHQPLRRAFEILRAECPDTNDEALLQGAVKAVNDTAGPNGLVPTLLVFGAMPRITKDSAPSANQVKRAEALNKAMTELRKLVAKRKIQDALNTRNGRSTESMLPRSLKLGSEVLVFREQSKWTGPYKVISVSDTAVTVEMVNGPTEFRSTHVKPYERLTEQQTEDPAIKNPEPFQYPEPIQPRKRGRPRKVRAPEQDSAEQQRAGTQFLVRKEQQSYDLATTLRNEGRITTAGKPFEQSDWEEIESLLAEGVIIPIRRSSFPSAKIFGCRLVREVKGLPNNPYEKSRLVVQGFSDGEKATLLTQAPTIMRCSQRVILALAPSLRKVGHQLMLRDISQAYTQSATDLQRDILLRIPKEMQNRYPDGMVFQVIKPLYGIAEAGLHWFATYQKHHREHLNCVPSSYDPCLLISKIGHSFGIVGMQTDDTLNLGEPAFIQNEHSQLVKAGFKAKPAQIIEAGAEGVFNGCIFEVGEGSVIIRQKGQADRLELVKADSRSINEQYIAQRARGAYIATTCQPEASFDFSVAAQTREPTAEDVIRLNKRIQWQIDSSARGLNYVPLHLESMALYVFVDGSFANNKDLSSQIGFVIVLGNERANKHEKHFQLSGNIVHWQSIKCKRVTRSVLASEIYGMVGGFDAAYVLKQMLVAITKRLSIPPTPLVMCTDSFSLYQCLVQLGTTAEKRLMIDLMALRQSYEERELDEVRWIAGGDNPADAMTKGSPNPALEKLVSTNQLIVRVEGWVNRSEKKSEGGKNEFQGASA